MTAAGTSLNADTAEMMASTQDPSQFGQSGIMSPMTATANKGKVITMVNTFKQNKTSYGRPMLDNQDLVKVSSKENILKKGRYTVDQGTMPEISSQQQATTQHVSGRHESSLTKDTVGGSIFDNNNQIVTNSDMASNQNMRPTNGSVDGPHSQATVPLNFGNERHNTALPTNRPRRGGKASVFNVVGPRNNISMLNNRNENNAFISPNSQGHVYDHSDRDAIKAGGSSVRGYPHKI